MHLLLECSDEINSELNYSIKYFDEFADKFWKIPIITLELLILQHYKVSIV